MYHHHRVPLFLFFLVLFCQIIPSLCQKRRSKPAIIGEDVKNRIPTRATQCIFGNATYELDEKWKPDLGPPVGIMYCVRCECVAANRKSRMVTRVKCKNIKHDCPKLDCDDPVLLPDRCCKTCPNEESTFAEDDLVGRKINRKEEEGKKIYSLVGKAKPVSSKNSEVPAPKETSAEAPVSRNSNLMDDQETNDITTTHKCFYEGNIFDDGSQWKAQHQDCQMCSCQVRKRLVNESSHFPSE